ncbi:MAG: hypothetical protein A3G34_06760 [Candidatus Lindowbacteria bacterium RIFCSPLOWO2_12_FULL_62_27]|nr:MAG: hypothetical protein A3G34_06760 [Candidatus Lindowbacteria bacterium RIFCSPLOWO2_12_FULL_62_27]OGH61270.1 MAG: hypothetical protein A3I06_13315 [Candidatus Lindowbacteria bacterium RIFCSPLOWO2_02_FULL_62_12]
MKRIESDPKICHGEPHIHGTRIMVANILSLIEGGYDIPRILRHYPDLTRADVKAAIRYAASAVRMTEEVPLT